MARKSSQSGQAGHGGKGRMSPARQILLALLALALVVLQARLWIGEGSLRHVEQLKDRVDTLEAENRKLRERNELIRADVRELKSGPEAVEGIARKDLGMIREGETFFLMVDEDNNKADKASKESSGEGDE